MAFDVNARVLLELGAELISSDSIALYELIKNSKDARSAKIWIRINVALTRSGYENAKYFIEHGDPVVDSETLKTEGLELYFSPRAPQTDINYFLDKIDGLKKADALKFIKKFYLNTSFIEVEDKGHGMSVSDLKSNYLTLGTSHRARQKLENTDGHIILGEKGIGRLSTMRLGKNLFVQSATIDDKNWAVLEIDWSKLEGDLDSQLSDFVTTPSEGQEKEAKSEHGTLIRISNLNEDWSLEKLVDIARTDIAKLKNPIDPKSKILGLDISFNGTPVENYVNFDRSFLDKYHGYYEVSLKYEPKDPKKLQSGEKGADNIFLKGFVEFRPPPRLALPGMPIERLDICINFETLNSVLATATAKLRGGGHGGAAERFIGIRSLGPFKATGYWFNRQRYKLETQEDDYAEFRSWMDRWSGGLLMYRDGYRVYPYATPDDDWLELDKKALSGRAYKLNRAQTVGYVDISASANKHLQDQTNRQGLRDTPEKRALVRCLQHVIWGELGGLVKKYEERTAKIAQSEFGDVDKQVKEKTKEARKTLNSLALAVPASRQIEITQIKQYCDEIEAAWSKAKTALKKSEEQHDVYLHLASVGLMMEFVVHELTRTAKTTLDNVKSIRKSTDSPAIETLFHQLKSLEKRLRILDPVSTPGRQVKSQVDIRLAIKNLIEAHSNQFDRHAIKVVINDDQKKVPFSSNIVEGYLYHIIENMITNSVYWLDHHRAFLLEEFNKEIFVPSIVITINPSNNTVVFSDNGPGISPTDKPKIFTPLFTMKPKGQGRGMGLYIANKLSKESSIKLTLESREDDGQFRNFVIEFPN
jgi:hypothetical protein